eukprot:COSAG06_NODE_413_length_16040_cov_8.901386_20_plen_228_part_00
MIVCQHRLGTDTRNFRFKWRVFCSAVTNRKGTVCFAQLGPGQRATQILVHLAVSSILLYFCFVCLAVEHLNANCRPAGPWALNLCCVSLRQDNSRMFDRKGDLALTPFAEVVDGLVRKTQALFFPSCQLSLCCPYLCPEPVLSDCHCFWNKSLEHRRFFAGGARELRGNGALGRTVRVGNKAHYINQAPKYIIQRVIRSITRKSVYHVVFVPSLSWQRHHILNRSES